MSENFHICTVPGPILHRICRGIPLSRMLQPAKTNKTVRKMLAETGYMVRIPQKNPIWPKILVQTLLH